MNSGVRENSPGLEFVRHLVHRWNETQAWNQVKSGNLVHLTLLYLALPLLIFLLGWLKFIYALPLFALLVYLLVQWGGEITADVRPNRKTLIVCGVVAVLWTATSGAGGVGFQSWDYLKHNAMLKELLVSEWPVILGPDKTLVYTLGYYLPAGAFGKIFGPTASGWLALNVFMFLWTAAGVYLTLLWFVHLVGGRPAIVAVLFVLLGGMDLAGEIFYSRGLELELWADFPVVGSLVFRSTTFSLHWAPQHSISAWLGAALFLQMKDEPAFWRNSLLFGALLSLWSFFSALGVALMMGAWLVIKQQHVKEAFSLPPSLLRQAGGALLILVIVLFLASSGPTPYGTLIKAITEDGLWPRYLLFLMLEFGLVAAIGFYLVSHHDRKLLFALCICLTILPLHYAGGSIDMAMNAALPLMFVFWCLVFRGFRERRADNFRAQLLNGLIVVAVVIGAASANERLILNYNNLAYHIQGRVFEDQWGSTPVGKFLYIPPLPEVKDIREPSDNFAATQYHGRPQSFFFRALASGGRTIPK